MAGLADDVHTTVVRDRGDGTEVRFGLTPEGRIVSAAGVGPGTSIVKEIRVAEMMIAARKHPAAEALANPDLPLKKLLKS